MRTADFKLSPLAQQVIGAVRAIGARPLLVGGCVRDAIMGITPKDIDIEVHNLSTVEGLVEALKTVGRVDAVGASFGVIKVGPASDPIDVSLPRRDSKVAGGHRGFVIEVDPSMTIEEAASRRDFTMNAIMFDPITETLIDPFHGQADIQAKVIRHTSEAFAEDPLRVLRAVQFAARFGFTIATETAELCRTLVNSYPELASERVWAEWEKVLRKGVYFVTALDVLRKTGWGVHFPEIASLVGGNTESVARRLEADVQYGPTEMRAIMTLASLTLDSGRALVKSIGAPRHIREGAAKIARGAFALRQIVSHTEVRQLARRLSSYSVYDACYIAPYGTPTIQRAAVDLGVWLKPLPLLLTGDDLIMAGYTPGPLFSQIMKAQIEAIDTGVITSREEAWYWLDKTFPLAVESDS